MALAPSEALREFHEFFGLPARDEATTIFGDELRLRRKLLEEEYDELSDELDYETEMQLDLVYKELADLVYVAYGLDQHLGSKLDAVFEAVHRSNMTKLWDCDSCTDGEYWIDGTMYDCSECKGTGKMVRYREDGKVLKPPTYEPPDIQKVISE